MTQILMNALDWGRDFFGLPRAVGSAPVRATEMLNFGEVAVSDSGLDARDQKVAMRMIAGLPAIYPDVTQDNMDLMIDFVISYVRSEAEKRVERHQMDLFDVGSLHRAEPLNRRLGVAQLRILAGAMLSAEIRMGDGARLTDGWVESAEAALDRVDDAMDVVCRSRHAISVAAEWGFVQNDFGALLTTRGTAFGSRDLFARLVDEPSVILDD